MVLIRTKVEEECKHEISLFLFLHCAQLFGEGNQKLRRKSFAVNLALGRADAGELIFHLHDFTMLADSISVHIEQR